MQKILMISYYYPPLVDVGSLRVLGFSKNLPAFGWEPYVLSVKNPDRSCCCIGNGMSPTNIKTFYARSLFNLAGITGKANGLIRRTLGIFGKELRSNIVQDLFCIPDVFIGWIPLSFIKGLKIINKYGIHTIYVSCKPNSSAITGILLKKATKKPLVLDLRDPIAFGYDGCVMPVSETRLEILHKFEGYVLREADRIIVSSDQIKERYLSLYPFLEHKIYRIYNGFFIEYLPKNEIKEFEKFTIIYTGSFYINVPPVDLFFKALQKVIRQGIVPRDKIQFLYLGQIRKKGYWLGAMVREHDLRDIVIAPGHVSLQESIQTVSRASLFLIRLMPPMINTKLYEALAVGIPILALGGKGDAQKLIQRYSRHSYVVTSDKVDHVADAIKNAYHKWEKGHLKRTINEKFMQNFNKRILTNQFVQVLKGYPSK